MKDESLFLVFFVFSDQTNTASKISVSAQTVHCNNSDMLKQMRSFYECPFS